MTRLCYDCYKNFFRCQERKRRFVLSKRRELCEGCGKTKRIVIKKWLGNKDLDRILTVYAKKEMGKFGSDEEIFNDLKKYFHSDK